MLNFNIITYIFIFIGGATSVLNFDEARARQYLKKYGYIDNQIELCDIDGVILEDALKEFQNIAGLRETGLPDIETMNRIDDFRCGMKDFELYNINDEDNDSWTWGRKSLTFAITEYPSYLRPDVTDKIIMQALTFMSERTNILFTPVSFEPDIEIKFVKFNKQNAYTSLEEESRITAKSSVPGLLGKIYINDEIEWSVKNAKGFSLFRTVVHQIGHIFGLGHENFTSIMSPFVGIQEEFNELKCDDTALNLLHALYGLPDFKSNILCKMPYIDSIFFTQNHQKLYVFVSKFYWKMDSERKVIESPKFISTKWKELEGPILAVYQDENGWTYFFTGTKLWKYFGNYLQDGYPKNIKEVFLEAPDTITSVIESNDQLLLIDSKYRYIYSKDNNKKEGYIYRDYFSQLFAFHTILYYRNDSTMYVFMNDKYDIISKTDFVNNKGSVENSYRYKLSEFFGCADKSAETSNDN
ncbi:matrix metalloproteinase-19-like [Arctopsyche grandis]|uniref:matrix metalloproteinase-19-like n=1 Tax=Arctopsyche grandis TaxID=121162 RepID=UPI00406D9428